MEKNKINKAIVYNKEGIDLIRNRQLKEIVSYNFSKDHIGKPIFICDNRGVHGIIVLNEPSNLTVDFFENHYSRHNITNKYRDEFWPEINKFYAYSFRIKKTFKKPLKYSYDGSLYMGKFIDNIEILEKGVIGYRDLGKSPIETAWNGPEERRKASVEVLRIICAWFDSENPDVKSSYKLPHHKAEGQHSAVFRGLVAAMGALLGARGGVDIPTSDRQGVYNHLARHYRDFDREPPKFKSYNIDELKSTFPELYKDVVYYEELLEEYKNMSCQKGQETKKALFIKLFELFIKRLIQKPNHAGRRQCPPGMVRDRQTGRCVRRNKSEDVDKDGVLKQIKIVEEGNFIRARLREPNTIVRDSFRTITLSESRGIKAIIGRLKSDPDGPTHVQSVLFEKDKWTISSAREWIENHKESLKAASYKRKDENKNMELANV